MSVSSLTRHDGDKNIYVQFSRGSDLAELTFPNIRILKNKGFTEEELRQLVAYMESDKDTIFSLAKQVNPLKAFMGQNGEKHE